MGGVLLVEGSDEVHVVSTLCEAHRVPKTLFAVEDQRGREQLLRKLPTRLRQQGTAPVGIVVDANGDLHGAWQAVGDRLAGEGYGSLPQTPDPKGTLLAAPVDALLPPVGIWLMPDNQSPGRLEDFLRELVPADDDLIDYADECVAGIGDRCRFRDSYRGKAVVRTWLAWQENPGRPFGTAITAKYLDPTRPAARAFVAWLRKLFT